MSQSFQILDQCKLVRLGQALRRELMALVTQTAQICLVIATLLYRGRDIVGHLIEALGFHAELLLVVASVCPSPNGRSRRGSEEVPDCGDRTIMQVRCSRRDASGIRPGSRAHGPDRSRPH